MTLPLSTAMPDETLRELIDRYYQFRNYRDPEMIDSLLWLVSEVGELVESINTVMAGSDWASIPNEKLAVLMRAMQLGRQADRVVGDEPGWVRNGDRKKKPRVDAEIADVLMMLDRVAKNYDSGADVVSCLKSKFKAKGFDCK